jgi:hypothetical protein
MDVENLTVVRFAESSIQGRDKVFISVAPVNIPVQEGGIQSADNERKGTFSLLSSVEVVGYMWSGVS